MSKRINPLRINVGFLVKAEAGYSRTIEFDVDEFVVPPDLNLTNLKGAAHFSRTPQGLVVDVQLSAHFPAECVRCLDPFDLAVATSFTELYAFDERSVTESQLLLPANHQIDLAPLAREYLFLDMPITPLCRTDCRGLCPVCGINRNREQCEHDRQPGDPRFSVLKDFLEPKE